MGCTLNKFKTYNVGQVRFDRGTSSYTVQLTDQIQKCPDGTFSSRKAKLVVQAGAPPSLSFDTAKNVPVITVPNEGFVINYGDAGFGFGSFLLLALAVTAVVVILRKLLSKESTPERTYSSPSAAPAYASTANAPSNPGYPTPGTTIVNNNSGPDLLTTVLVADMLTNHNHGGGSNNNTTINNTTIVERDTDRDDSFSSDSGSSSSNDDSFSSDSSSDDSSSSSDFSSDSSGGGSDFSSDN